MPDELDDMAAAPDLDPIQEQVLDDQRFADGDDGGFGVVQHGALQSQPTALNTERGPGRGWRADDRHVRRDIKSVDGRFEFAVAERVRPH